MEGRWGKAGVGEGGGGAGRREGLERWGDAESLGKSDGERVVR